MCLWDYDIDHKESLYIFNKDFDFDETIIHKSTVAPIRKDNVIYSFGWEFDKAISHSKQLKFCKKLKRYVAIDSYNLELERFVVDGVFNACTNILWNEFDVVLSTSNDLFGSSIKGLMNMVFWEETRADTNCNLYRDLESFYTEMKLNEKECYKHMLSNYDLPTANNLLKLVKNQYEEIKNKGELLKMSKYKPIIDEIGFLNFLIYENEHLQSLYNLLCEGCQIIICEDFLSPHIQLNNLLKLINYLNPNNQVSIYVLIKTT